MVIEILYIHGCHLPLLQVNGIQRHANTDELRRMHSLTLMLSFLD